LPTIKVPQSDGQIGLYFGESQIFYHVKDGELVVPDEHAAAVLSIPGSELKTEKPSKEK
jgi:hypothetical protein